MFNRYLGIFLIAVAVTACGEAVDAGDATAVGPTLGFTAGYPTATIEIPKATEEAQLPTGETAIEAQIARGWPTVVGWPDPTGTPSPTPVDKSKWTIIEPGACDPGTAITVGDLFGLRRDIFAFIFMSEAGDEAELVKMADLIIHGVPVGQIEAEPPRNGLDDTYFYQDVRVLSVLHGQATGDTVRVLQIGVGYATSPRSLEEHDITLGSGEDYGWPGPLQQCPQILFLNESSVDIYPSVGLTQGVFSLGADGRVTYAQEFKSFEGLDVAEVKQRIEMLSVR